MINWVKAVFSSTVYIQLWEDRVKIVNVGSKTVFDERPYIALSGKEKKPLIEAVGNNAYGLKGSGQFDVSNPFSHPRLLVNDFEKATKVIQYGIVEVCRAQRFQPSPIAVIHPQDRLEGGITDVECRLFRELALSAGARKVYLHIGNEIPLIDFSLSRVNEPEII